jgi:hypothetical protein
MRIHFVIGSRTNLRYTALSQHPPANRRSYLTQPHAPDLPLLPSVRSFVPGACVRNLRVAQIKRKPEGTRGCACILCTATLPALVPAGGASRGPGGAVASYAPTAGVHRRFLDEDRGQDISGCASDPPAVEHCWALIRSADPVGSCAPSCWSWACIKRVTWL